MDDFYGVRPAFNVNLQSVIFTSAAEGGKSSGTVGAGALTAVSAMNALHSTDPAKQNTWKLTLKDSAHSSFTASTTSYDSSTGVLTFTYSDAVLTADNDFVSVIVTDSTGAIRYYGHVADKDTSGNSATVNLSGKINAGDKVYAFNEQVNEDKKTDYASDVQELQLATPTVAYTVKFQGNGADGGSMPDQNRTVGDGKALDENKFSLTGYTFTGWNTQADGNGTPYTDKATGDLSTTAGDITLYAQWAPISYTVRFNNNGGSGTMLDQSRKYDDGLELTGNTFTNGTFLFTGWNTDPNGSGAAYADKSTENLTNAGGVTVTLYAMWNLAQITTSSLPDGTEGIAYSETLTTSGTTGKVTWTLDSGTLPDGLTLDGANGIISGTPSNAGNYTFTLKATDNAATPNVLTRSYTITISAKSSPAPAPTPPPSDPCATGHATYHWITVRAADEHNDGEMVYVCSACGHELYRVPISGYIVFNKNTMQKILDAPQGATISVSTRRWISFHRMVYQALADRPDVTLKVSFLDGGYHGNRYSVTIPAGYDTLSLLNGTDYCGFLYLGSKFGLSPGE